MSDLIDAINSSIRQKVKEKQLPIILNSLQIIIDFCKSQGCCRDCPITTRHSICPFRGMPSQWQNKRFKEVLEVIL